MVYSTVVYSNATNASNATHYYEDELTKSLLRQHEVGEIERDLSDAVKYYLKFNDVFETCGGVGATQGEDVKNACLEIIREYADIMRPFIGKNKDKIDTVLYK